MEGGAAISGIMAKVTDVGSGSPLSVRLSVCSVGTFNEEEEKGLLGHTMSAIVV